MARFGYGAIRRSYATSSLGRNRRVTEKFGEINGKQILLAIDSYSSDTFVTHDFVSKHKLNLVSCNEAFDTLGTDATAHYNWQNRLI